jgi:hydroxypyruvate reductase
MEIADHVLPDETLLLLLSGGASALLALPAPHITLDDKRRTIELMMHGGADIGPLNTIRKHLSAIKGGQLAVRCAGTTLTLAVSDVVGDDVSVIGSGPGVADDTTWQDAVDALERFGGQLHPAAVRARLAAGLAGQVADTPKRRDTRLARASGQVIASRMDALAGARSAAEALGYHVIVLAEPVVGEAREAARQWYGRVQRHLDAASRPVCLISAGETTVRVTGTGRGGRNQEFALALAGPLRASHHAPVAASVGTDGIDGPTEAAGAFVDATTIARAAAMGIADPEVYLGNNDSHAFFEPLGDLIRLGRTDTNVGDLQIYLHT